MAIPIAEEIIQGSTRPTLPIAFVKTDGSPVVITGATLAGKVRKLNNVGAGTALAGSLSESDGPNGKATLAYAAADVAVAGMMLVQLTVTISGQPYIRQFIQPIREAL